MTASDRRALARARSRRTRGRSDLGPSHTQALGTLLVAQIAPRSSCFLATFPLPASLEISLPIAPSAFWPPDS
eukprot:2429486-Rhodomonas_salina.1